MKHEGLSTSVAERIQKKERTFQDHIGYIWDLVGGGVLLRVAGGRIVNRQFLH